MFVFLVDIFKRSLFFNKVRFVYYTIVIKTGNDQIWIQYFDCQVKFKFYWSLKVLVKFELMFVYFIYCNYNLQKNAYIRWLFFVLNLFNVLFFYSHSLTINNKVYHSANWYLKENWVFHRCTRFLCLFFFYFIFSLNFFFVLCNLKKKSLG